MSKLLNPIYSIGHGNRSIEEFISLLMKYKIQYLIDVRTNPFSKFNPNFNREVLPKFCKENNISYVFMGDGLGGKPKDRTCYDNEGHVVYRKIREKDFFNKSANRLITAYQKNLKVACMCSEINPCDCHRSKLIGEYLTDNDIEMLHINKKGDLITQSEVINEITQGYEMDLFGNTVEMKSIGVY